MSLDWMESSACSSADPEEWTPDKGGGYGRARRICLGCDVLAECDAWITEYERGQCSSLRVGMWAAKTPRERAAADPTVLPRKAAAA